MQGVVKKLLVETHCMHLVAEDVIQYNHKYFPVKTHAMRLYYTNLLIFCVNLRSFALLAFHIL